MEADRAGEEDEEIGEREQGTEKVEWKRGARDCEREKTNG